MLVVLVLYYLYLLLKALQQLNARKIADNCLLVWRAGWQSRDEWSELR